MVECRRLQMLLIDAIATAGELIMVVVEAMDCMFLGPAAYKDRHRSNIVVTFVFPLTFANIVDAIDYKIYTFPFCWFDYERLIETWTPCKSQYPFTTE
eukprot:5743480-Ditylum_brightwellii.AAC.1